MAAAYRPRNRSGPTAQSGNVLEIVLGDGRRLLADLFFVKADAYFHRGYYPSVFDPVQAFETPHVQESTEKHEVSDGHQHEEEHAREMDFLGQPKDWIDRFGRHFYVSQHVHFDRPEEAKELLPWLRFSAELDPHRVETYIIAAFWLRTQLHREDEAMRFLREGWRANPDSYAILLELGRLFYQNRKDAIRARNVWELACANGRHREANRPEPTCFTRKLSRTWLTWKSGLSPRAMHLLPGTTAKKYRLPRYHSEADRGKKSEVAQPPK